MLEIAHDVGEAVDVVDGMEPGRFGARRNRKQSRELATVHIDGPEEIVDVHLAVLADEQRA